MRLPFAPEFLLRPSAQETERLLFLARHAPLEPDFTCRAYAGDGGYPAYYHRLYTVLNGLGYEVLTSNEPQALFGPKGAVDLVVSFLNRMPMATPEVLVAAQCAYVGLPILGAGANVRALAEDKWFSKLAASAAGLPTAKGAVYATPEALQTPPDFPGPYFVKNRFGAASEGVSDRSIQDDWQGAKTIARELMARGMSALIEQYAPGLDVTVPVLGGASPIVLGLVAPGSNRRGGIITEDLKRNDPLGYQIFDAGPASEGFLADVGALWRAAGPIDYFRMDYRFDPATGKRVFLEFNICCHIGRSGAICLAASQWGLNQADVLGHVIEFSLTRQRQGARRWAS